MKCEEFEDRLNEVLDEHRRPEWDDRLRMHGEHCATCRELAASYGVLLDGLSALSPPQAPADMSRRVLSQLRVRRKVSQYAALASAVLATAAAVMVAAWPMLPKFSKRPDPAPAVDVTLLQAAAYQQFDWADLDQLPFIGPVWLAIHDGDETTDPYAVLAKETGQGLASVVIYMPGIGGPRGFIGTAPGTMGTASVWPGPMSDELRPVRESLVETIDLLLQVVPLGDLASRS
jgi:hypothetical protein